MPRDFGRCSRRSTRWSTRSSRIKRPRRGGNGVRQPKGPRPARPSRIPTAITARFDDLVYIAGEANAWPYAQGTDNSRDELVHWLAHRPSTGATLRCLSSPRRPKQEAFAPSTDFHTGISIAQMRAGATRAELFARFAEFLTPSTVICAWGYYATDLFTVAGGTLPAERIDLRAVAHRLLNRKVGRLEDYAATLGPAPAPLGLGRAGRRLAMLAQIIATWREI